MARQRQLRACAHRGVSEGDVPPSEAGRFLNFENWMAQFGECFWATFWLIPNWSIHCRSSHLYQNSMLLLTLKCLHRTILFFRGKYKKKICTFCAHSYQSMYHYLKQLPEQLVSSTWFKQSFSWLSNRINYEFIQIMNYKQCNATRSMNQSDDSKSTLWNSDLHFLWCSKHVCHLSDMHNIGGMIT